MKKNDSKFKTDFNIIRNDGFLFGYHVDPISPVATGFLFKAEVIAGSTLRKNVAL